MKKTKPIRTGQIQLIALASIVVVLVCLFCFLLVQRKETQPNPINLPTDTYALKPSWVVLDSLEVQKRKDSLAVLNRKNKAQINQLTLDFSPSFIEKSQVLIEKQKDGYKLTISSDKISDTCQLTESSMVDLNYFLGDYLTKKFTYDSLETVRIQKGIRELALDGTTVDGMLDGKSFTFWSPNKGTINHTFMWLLFRLMNASFRKMETVIYLENLEGYFRPGLGLKKLKDNPLTYRWYGSVSSDEEKELYDFFGQLPTDKEISFDMSNFEAMGAKFYESFKALCTRNPTIKWINCSDGVKKQLTEAGIKPSSFK